MIEEFWATFPENAPKHYHHSITRDEVQLNRCDNDVYIFATIDGEFWSYEEAKGLTDPQSPTVSEFFNTVNSIKLYLSQFGLGDWGTGVKFYTPHDWRVKGNAYPSLNSGALAVMTYDGGAWFSVMNAENGTEIRDGFTFWLGDRYNYEILNSFSLVIYKQNESAYQTPHDVALANFQSASDIFARTPNAANYDALNDACIELMRVEEVKAKAAKLA